MELRRRWAMNWIRQIIFAVRVQARGWGGGGVDGGSQRWQLDADSQQKSDVQVRLAHSRRGNLGLLGVLCNASCPPRSRCRPRTRQQVEQKSAGGSTFSASCPSSSMSAPRYWCLSTRDAILLQFGLFPTAAL